MSNRYTRINDYYIKDNYTGKKYGLTETVKLLNLYERIIMEYKSNEASKRIIE